MRLESTRVFGLDVMRASAIALVLLSHTTLWFSGSRVVFGIGLLAGYFGVELFFILSGFLIGGILLRSLSDRGSTVTLLSFWRRRWLRTLPNYFLFLALNALLFVWLYRAAPPLLPYLCFGQNIVNRPPSFFVESWSLAVEEWFYILLPVLFLIALKISPRRFQASSLAAICGVIASVTLARSLYSVLVHPGWLTNVRMIVVYRLDACMFGVLAAWTKHFYPEWWQNSSRLFPAAGLLTLATLGVLPFVLPADSLFFQTFGFTLTSSAAMLLLPALDRWRASTAFWSGPVVKTSLWSYSLYLVNLPVFAIVFARFHQTAPFTAAALFLFCSVFMAALIHRLYEKPIMDSRKRPTPPVVFGTLNEAITVAADR